MKKLSVILTVVLCFALLPFSIKADAAPDIYIKSETAVLMDADTGAVLFSKNMNRQMYPASITKVMTGMLALEMADTSELMTASHNAVYSLPYNTSHIALAEGEQLTLEHAMYALGIESANDAANVIAEHIGTSVENFAQLMTQKARSLGAVNTNFTNPHGLPDDNQHTTAYDMALITAAAIKTEGFNRYFSTNRHDMPQTNMRDIVRQFWNANYYINGYEECAGLVMSKTGWTEEAKHTMVTAAQRDGRTLIAIVMSSTHKGDKYDDTTALLDYGFENFFNTQLDADFVKGKTPLAITFTDGTTCNIEQSNVLADGCLVTLPKDKTTADITFKADAAQLNEAKDFATVDLEARYTDDGSSYYCGSTSVSLLFVKEEEKGFDFAGLLQKIVLIILSVILWIIIALLVFIALKQLVIIENRRRNRKKRQAQLRAKRQKELQEKTVYRK